MIYDAAGVFTGQLCQAYFTYVQPFFVPGPQCSAIQTAYHPSLLRVKYGIRSRVNTGLYGVTNTFNYRIRGGQ